MQRVHVTRTEKNSGSGFSFPWQKIFGLWALTSMIVPGLLIYGVLNFGSPALLIADERNCCVYVDVFGSFQVKGADCSWYAFRKIDIWRNW